ncbi:trypsin-like serine protease [Pendulispora rubella]|uniref:Trypsin-like serine protease n=1 Tax=Pendulispora rubella TaxID=2741070 RepID=A0ABZ2KV38_9BACT
MMGCATATDESNAPESEIAESESPIIGGAIDQGDPGVVLVRFGRGSYCTGEVVSPHVVTTAAHCVKGKSGWTVDTTYDGRGTRRTVKEAYYHPSYSGTLGKYDVGVLILNDALSVTPIPLNRRALQNSDIGKNVRIIGYGDSTLDGNGYGKRRQATVKIVSFASTSVTIGNVRTDGKVQCYGDSGGPALLSIDGVERIIGFDSGNHSDVCDQDDLNTRADTTVGFIDPYIEKYH